MAAISEQDVLHIAKLARLNLTDAEIRQFTHQLGSILKYVEKLNELDTTDIEPTAHAAAVTNVFREDHARPGMGLDAVLRNAPAKEGRFFSVPKVLDQGEASG